MARFGEPGIIAGMFPLRAGLLWFLLERGAALIFFWIFFFSMISFNDPAWIAASGAFFWTSLVGIDLLVGPLWQRVHVNGGLKIRLLFRKEIHLPFEAIRSVRFEKGHLFGIRRLVYEHAGGRVRVRVRTRGTSAAVLALKALRPDVMAPDLIDYALGASRRRERPTARWGISGLWLAALVLLAAAASDIAKGWGWPWMATGAAALGLVTAILQAAFHTDRRRSSCMWLSAAGIMILAPVTVAAIFNGSVASIWWAALCLAGVCVFGIGSLWSPSMRMPAFAVAVMIAIVLSLICRAISDGVYTPSETVGRSERAFPNGFVEIPMWETLAWPDVLTYEEAGYESDPNSLERAGEHSRFVVFSSPEIAPIELPRTASRAGWRFVPAHPNIAPMLHDTLLNDDPPRVIWWDEAGEWNLFLEFEEASPRLLFGGMTGSYSHPWSPEADRLLLDEFIDDAHTGVVPRVVDTEFGTSYTLPPGTVGSYEWINSNTIQTYHVRSPALNERTQDPRLVTEIESHELDLTTGELRNQKRLTLEHGERVSSLPGGRYGFLQHVDEDGLILDWNWIDVRTGVVIPMPRPEGMEAGEMAYHIWNPESRRSTYLILSAEARRTVLILASPEEGLIAWRRIDDAYDFYNVEFSPDGNLLYVKLMPVGGWFTGRLHRREVWDMERGRTWRLRPTYFWGIVVDESLLQSSTRFSADGRSVFFVRLHRSLFRNRREYMIERAELN